MNQRGHLRIADEVSLGRGLIGERCPCFNPFLQEYNLVCRWPDFFIFGRHFAFFDPPEQLGFIRISWLDFVPKYQSLAVKKVVKSSFGSSVLAVTTVTMG